MSPRRKSLVLAVAVALVAVTAGILGGFAWLTARSEQARELARLRRQHEVLTEQLAVSLALPIWNFDRAQIARIVDGALADAEVVAVVVRLEDLGHSLIGRQRGPGQTILVLEDERQVPAGLIRFDRSVETSGDRLGTLSVWITDRFVNESVRAELIASVWRIVVVAAALVVSVYGILWWLLLRPLGIVVNDALAIRQGRDLSAVSAGRPFYGEMESLRTSLLSTLDTLRRQNRLQEMLTAMAANYINLPLEAVESEIQISLGELGRFVDADTVRIFEYGPDQQTGSCTHEWSRDGILPGRAELQNLPVATMPDWDIDAHRRGEVILIPDVASLPPGGLRSLQEKLGVRSTLAIPCMSGNVCLGFISFAWTMPRHVSSVGEQHLLTVFAALLENLRRRKEAETAIRGSEQNFRAMFDLASIGMAQADPQTGQWRRVNKKMCTITGYSAAEMLQMRVPDITHPDDRASDWAAFERVVRGEAQHHSLEKRYVRKDGSIAWVNVNRTVLRDPAGQPTQTMATIEDITQRRQAEESLRRLATAVDQTGESIVITDTQGNILYVNPAFEKTTGYTRTETLGRNSRLLKSGQHDVSFYRGMWETLTRGEVWHGRFVNRRKDGGYFEEDASISPLRDDAGTIVNYVAVKRDVTREVQLEAQLRQAQKMEAVGQLAGGVAHDFNNIIAALMMGLEILREETNLKPEQLQLLRDLEGETRRAASLTRQLLMFSRRSVLESQVLDLNAVVAGLLKMLRRLLGEHIALVFERENSLPAVEADSGMLEQMLLNLAVNARDAMPTGGQITLATAVADVDPPQVAMHPERRVGRFVRLSVSDTGCGMDEATRRRIFEPFFTTKAVGKGTGLGLATVYGIVVQHGGWVEVESQVQCGTTFQIFLPATATQAAPAAPKETPVVPGGHETLLVVEDDESVRRLLLQTLRVLGYRVLGAANGQEAMNLWRQHGSQINLLLTDMVMPEGMTGLELAERVREERPGLKVIISSGYSTEITRLGKATAEGIVYLPKPYEVAQLGAILRRCLDSP